MVHSAQQTKSKWSSGLTAAEAQTDRRPVKEQQEQPQKEGRERRKASFLLRNKDGSIDHERLDLDAIPPEYADYARAELAKEDAANAAAKNPVTSPSQQPAAMPGSSNPKRKRADTDTRGSA